MTKSKKWALLTVLLFFVWGGVSYQWYTCGIKGFCEQQKVETSKKSEKKECGTYLNNHIKLGAANDAVEVRKLETFLKEHEHAAIEIDGVYTPSDEAAVRLFQEKYRAEILDPWGMSRPSGFVYKTTRNKINELYCATQ